MTIPGNFQGDPMGYGGYQQAHGVCLVITIDLVITLNVVSP